jgi:hypothetical protein
MVGSGGYTLNQSGSARNSILKEKDGHFRYGDKELSENDAASCSTEDNGTTEKQYSFGDIPTTDVTHSTSIHSLDIRKKENKSPMVGVFELVCILSYTAQFYTAESSFNRRKKFRQQSCWNSGCQLRTFTEHLDPKFSSMMLSC